MIEHHQGDILKAEADALVNTVNCVGVMGRGIALQFKKAFPEMFQEYQAACRRGEVRPGRVFTCRLERPQGPRCVINFPTKRHWRAKSRMEDIESGLVDLVREVRELGLASVAIPPLGCGLGGLDWDKVSPRIESAFGVLPEVRVLIFEPAGAPPSETMAKSPKRPQMTEGRAALLGLMRRYLAAVMDPFVSLLEIHKLMYFVQEAGQELRLRFDKGIYGPYATNLRHVLSHLEGHFLSGYGDGEDRPDKEIRPEPEAIREAEAFLASHMAPRDRFDRVAELIEGFETPFGLELLSTVHWVVAREGAKSVEDAVAKTYAWNSRKKMFKPNQIAVAWDVLERKGWLEKGHADAPLAGRNV